MPKQKQSPPPEPAEENTTPPHGYITNDPDHPVARERQACDRAASGSRLVDRAVLLAKASSVLLAFALLFYVFLA